MKHKLLYRPPDSGIVPGASIKRIIDDILNRDESYWCEANCHGTIWFGRDTATAPTTTIVYSPKFGYHLTIAVQEKGNEVTYIASGNVDFKKSTKVWLGQNYIHLPRAFFVDREVAAHIVRTFCTSGLRDSSVTWLNWDEVDWKFYPDEDDGEF